MVDDGGSSKLFLLRRNPEALGKKAERGRFHKHASWVSDQGGVCFTPPLCWYGPVGWTEKPRESEICTLLMSSEACVFDTCRRRGACVWEESFADVTQHQASVTS